MKAGAQETIQVTGATGNIGSEVVRQLSSTTPPVNIKAAVHSTQNIKKVKEEGDRVNAVLIDYNKPETLKEALDQVDKLFLLLMCQMRPILRLMRLLKQRKLELDTL
jgi:uncharacterized protein YbjT (DUF2867 family)